MGWLTPLLITLLALYASRATGFFPFSPRVLLQRRCSECFWSLVRALSALFPCALASLQSSPDPAAICTTRPAPPLLAHRSFTSGMIA
jgi:hypothetical protein